MDIWVVERGMDDGWEGTGGLAGGWLVGWL